jgi:hypothetical protein
MVNIIAEGRVFELLYFIAFTLVILYSTRAASKDVYVRRIPALDSIDEVVERAVEMGRPIHISPSMRSIDTQMIASLNLVGYVANQCAEKGCEIIATTIWPSMLPVLEDLIKTGYIKAGRPEEYNPQSVRFLSAEANAYATAASALVERENCAGNMQFGDTGGVVFVYFARTRNMLKDVMQIGGTARIGNIVHLIAGCDYFLIGDELYAASAYLDREPSLLAAMRTQDIVKIILIALTLLGGLLAAVGSDIILNIFNM